MRSHDGKGAGERAASTRILPMPTAGKRSLTEQLPTGVAPAPGSPLPAAIRAKMERALGADFAQVRVRESDHARALGAIAFTQGDDITFAPGHYDPDSAAGQRLLGHELAHVVQQRGGRVATPTTGKVQTDGGLEAEADALGDRAAAGEHAAADVPAARGAAPRSAPIQRKVLLDGSIDDKALATPAKLYAEREGGEVEMFAGADLSKLGDTESLSIFGHGSEGSHGAPTILALLNDPERGLPPTWTGTLYLGYCHAGNEIGDEGKDRSLVTAVATGLIRRSIAVSGAEGQAISQYGGEHLSKVIAERVIRREVAMLFSEPGGLSKDKEERKEQLREYYEDVAAKVLDKEVASTFMPLFLKLMLSDEERSFPELCNAAIELCEKCKLMFPSGEGMQTATSEGFSSENWGTRSEADRRSAMEPMADAHLLTFARGVGGESLEIAVKEVSSESRKMLEERLETIRPGLALVPKQCGDATEDLDIARTSVQTATQLLSEENWDASATAGAVHRASSFLSSAFGLVQQWDPDAELEQRARGEVMERIETLNSELSGWSDPCGLWRAAVIDCIATHE